MCVCVYFISILLVTACSFNTFGVNCSNKCSDNCAGPNKACHSFSGFCTSGCGDGYQGGRCQDRKLNSDC